MKLKKLIAIFLIATLFVVQLSWVSLSNIVYAIEKQKVARSVVPSFETSIEKVNASQETIEPGEEFEVNMKIDDFQNIEQGLISLGGQLEYDTNVLEKVEITQNESQWNPSVMNEDNFKFVTDAENYVTEGGKVFTIKFKAKDTITEATQTTIAIKNVVASNGLMDIESNDAQLEVKIEMPKQPDSITSEKYVIEEDIISRIAPKTTVKVFKENVEAVGELVFTDKTGKVLGENDVLGTGMKLQVGDTLHFTLVVTGDIDENGELNITDLAQMKLHYIEKQLLTGISLKAADIDGNGEITITDLAQIKLVLIGKKEIK